MFEKSKFKVLQYQNEVDKREQEIQKLKKNLEHKNLDLMKWEKAIRKV